MTRFLAVFALIAFSIAAAQDRFDQVQAKVVHAIQQSDAAAMEAEFNTDMQAAVPEPKIKDILGYFSGQMGKFVRVASSTRPSPITAVYRLQFERSQVDMEMTLDESNHIAGLRFTPVADVTSGPQKHETKLSLPFRGTWLIFWGGDTPETNGAHMQVPGQRFAFDIVGVGPDGKTKSGDGSKNEDFYAFGREVLAPADGVVTEVINGVHDNSPGSMNPFSAVGNAILIEHRAGEVSLLAHLKLDSIRVKPGDHVKRGQVLAQCGNSGNSSEPHLHYHLQNSTVIQDGVGIRVHFDSLQVTRDGKTEVRSNYSPVKGDVISLSQ